MLLALVAALISRPSAAEPEERSADFEYSDDLFDDDGGTVYRSVTRAEQSAPIERGATSTVDLSGARERRSTMADSLAFEPGVSVRRAGAGPASAFLSIRGASHDQVAFFLDGVPLNGAGDTTVDLSTLPPELFGTATIHRSVVPLRLGAPLPGGAVELESRFRDPGVHGSVTAGSLRTVELGLGISGATPGDGQTMALAHVSTSANRFRYFDDGGTEFDPTDDAFGRRQNAEVTAAAALVRDRRRLGELRLTSVGLGSWRSGGVPGSIGVPAVETSFSDWRAHVGAELLGDRLRAPGVRLRGVASVTTSGTRFDNPEAELGQPGGSSADTVVRGFSSFHAAAVAGIAEVGAVVDGSAESFSRDDDAAPSALVRGRVGVGGELALRSHDDRVRGEVAVRGDAVASAASSANAGSDTTFPSAHAGLAVSPWLGRLAVFATASTASRPPSFVELFGRGGAMVGNPDLDRERQVGGDAGLRFDTGDRVSVTARYAAYVRRVVDRITYIETGQGARVPVNLGRANLTGHELDLLMRHRLFDARVAGERIDAREPSAGGRVPFVAPWSISGAVGAIAGPARAEYGVEWRDRYWVDNANQRPSPARATQRAALRLAPNSLPGWVAVLQMENIADVRVADVAYRDGGRTRLAPQPVADYEFFPLPGRTFFVTIGYAPASTH